MASTIDDTRGMRGSEVVPDGSNCMRDHFSARASTETPLCRAREAVIDKASRRPEIVEPDLSALRKISPSRPSGYSPVVM